MAQWWSTSLPRRGSRVRSPSRALANKKGYPSGYPFLLARSAMHFSNACCFAAWVRFLGALKLSSVVPMPRSTGPCGTRLALFYITKGLPNAKSFFCYPRSAGHFSKPNCFAVWVRFLGALKLSSVVPEPRSTGPCGTRLAHFPSLTNRYSFPSLFHKPFPNDLSFPDIPAQKQLHHNSLFCTNI